MLTQNSLHLNLSLPSPLPPSPLPPPLSNSSFSSPYHFLQYIFRFIPPVSHSAFSSFSFPLLLILSVLSYFLFFLPFFVRRNFLCLLFHTICISSFLVSSISPSFYLSLPCILFFLLFFLPFHLLSFHPFPPFLSPFLPSLVYICILYSSLPLLPLFVHSVLFSFLPF